MSLDLLRQQIKELSKQRDNAILEKGLMAEENKDLRENFAYDYWVEKEMVLTAKIRGLIKEIDRITKKKVVHNTKKLKTAEVEKIKCLPKTKWL